MVNQNLNLDPLFFLGSIRRLFDKAEQPLTNSYRQHPWVYAATKAISQSVAAVPFKIWKDDEFKSPIARKEFAKEQYKLESFKGEDTIKNQIIRKYSPDRYRKVLTAYYQKDFKTVQKLAGFEAQKNGPLVDLFDSPSGEDGQTVGFFLWLSTIGYFIHEGASFWVLRGKRTRSELPKSIEVYGPTGWEALVSDNGRKVIGWERNYKDGKGKQRKESFKPWQVIWFKNWNPNEPFKPLPWNQPAILSIEQDHEASIYNRAFFKNGAEAGVVLETEQKLNKDQRNAIIESWNQRHQGSRHAHKPVMLDGGLKARLMRGSHRDMEYHLLKGLTRDETLATHQTPKAIVGVIEDVNRASFLGSKKTFFELALIPIMEYISQCIYAQLIRPFDPTLFGFFDLALVEGLRGDIKEKSDVAIKYHNLGVPFNIINERFDLGFPTIEFGDISFMASHTTEQIVSGAILSIGDNQNSPDAGQGTGNSNTDDTDDTDGQAPQSDDQSTLNDSEKTLVSNNQDLFEDLFSINEFLIAKYLINKFNFDLDNVADIVDNITNIVSSSYTNKFNPISVEDCEKEIISNHVKCFLANNMPKKNKNKLNTAIFNRKTAKFARILTTKIINYCILSDGIISGKMTKTWINCKNCQSYPVKTPIDLLEEFKAIPDNAVALVGVQYPNEGLTRFDCQCSIIVR